MSDQEPQPSPPTAPSEMIEEVRLGGSPSSRAANAALIALSRTARSFLLYGAENDSIRSFLKDLRQKFTEALRIVPSFTLEIRAFEMALGAEVVYLERERERSLAYSLFRDGVRRLTIAREVPWEELLRLLEILSIRYSSLRQNEDDVVTLLKKASFSHIHIDVVEGFNPTDEDRPAGRKEARAGDPASRLERADDWDLPLRPLEGRAPVQYRPVSDADRERLCAEEAPAALPANAVRAAIAMLRAATDPDDPTTLEDVTPFIGEIRDFLLSEGALSEAAELVRALRALPERHAKKAAALVQAFAGKRSLQQMLQPTPGEEETAGSRLPAILELLDLVPADHLADAIELIGEETDPIRRGQLRTLLERQATGRPEELFARLRTVPPAVAAELLRVCARAFPDRAVQAALDMARNPDEGVALEVLRILAAAPSSPAIAVTLVTMLESPSPEVRLRVAEKLALQKEHAAFGPLVRHVERRAHHSLTTREADSYGQGLARLSPRAALPLFKAWLHEQGALERLMAKPHERLLRWAAISGLGELGEPEAEALIRNIADHVDDELRAHCASVLARRGRKGPSGG